MTLFEVLRNELGNDKAVMDLALRKVFSHLKPYRGVKDLSRHVDDMVQNILADWILVPAKEDLELPQIITYAQERGRFCIQSYLEKFEFVVEVPRAVQRSKFGQEFTYGIVSSRELASPDEMILKEKLNLVTRNLRELWD